MSQPIAYESVTEHVFSGEPFSSGLAGLLRGPDEFPTLAGAYALQQRFPDRVQVSLCAHSALADVIHSERLGRWFFTYPANRAQETAA